MSDTPLIETSNLTVSLPARRSFPSFRRTPRIDILCGVSLAIRPGEIVCMVGESGSGKTTFGRALLGLVTPSSGSITFEGTPLPGFQNRNFRTIRQKSALLFQDPVSSFDPRQRIGSIIAEPRRILGEGSTGPEDIAALARSAGLGRHFLSRFPHALSGGQARRAAVARALSGLPKLIVADEPTAGLDVSVQGGVLNLFKDIRAEHNTAFLMITHNLSVARHVADRIVILYLGRVVESGLPRDIFAAPRHPYSAALISSEPVPDPGHRRSEPPVLGEVPSLLRRPAGCEFHTRCRHVRDRCRVEAPEMTSLSPTHRVACHFPLAAPPTDHDTDREAMPT
nr:ABC transporter ATP-binding protein [uncultured Gellertiella sp.]